MKPITFDSTCYRIDGKPIYLLAGEFHYFRVPKPDWRRRMGLFKNAGGNCLATYIPWLIHEPSEGQFDFSGADWLDLEGFLQAAQEEDLYVIARPGPYQYSELVYHGLPGWLVRDYPQVLAQKPDGSPIGYASVSYTHPLFLEKVQRWFGSVLPILARHTVSRGGPVVFTQIDNEMVGIHQWFGSLDYHPVTMGIGKTGGAYPTFLEKRYRSIESLNNAYEQTCGSFAEVPAVPQGNQSPAAQIRQRKDYFDFYLGTVADYAQFLTGLIREHGIDTPIMHNSANPGMNAYFLETAERIGGAFLLGSDHYYNLNQDWPQNNPTPQYAARCFVSLEMLRLMGYPPSVLEMPGGSASHWPPITAGDALAAYLANLAFGMKGSNYYIFTGGPNPPGTGQTTPLYDYGAGIGANGEIRPLYEAQKQFGQWIAQHPGWLTAERRADFRIGLDLEYSRAGQYWLERGPFSFSPAEADQFLRKGILTTALCASLSPLLVDLSKDNWVNDMRTPLIVASSASMAEEKQRRLVAYLKNGGRLVVAPVLPYLDENLFPCTVLADYLGSPRQSAVRYELSRPRILDTTNVFGQIHPFDDIPSGAAVIGVDAFSQKAIALSVKTPEGGQAILLGFHWNHAMREHEQMLSSLLHSLGIDQCVLCSNPNLWVTLYTYENRAVLFVLNLLTSPQEAEIEYRLYPGQDTQPAGSIKVEPITVRVIEIDTAG